MNRYLLLCVPALLCLSIFLVEGQEMERVSVREELLSVLEKFQDGYTKRDISIVDAYVEELFTSDVLLIGTASSEWCNGKEDVRRIVESDWQHWGDLKLDIDRAVIRTGEKVAWIAVQGTSTRQFDSEDFIYQRYGVRDAERILDQDQPSKTKLLEVLVDAAELLMEVEKAGTTFVYPIRVAASLIKEGDKWKFHQMAFSYPYPRRLILDEQQ